MFVSAKKEENTYYFKGTKYITLNTKNVWNGQISIKQLLIAQRAKKASAGVAGHSF